MAIVVPDDWLIAYGCFTRRVGRTPWIYTTERCPFYVLMQKMLEDKAMGGENCAGGVEEAIREFIKAKAGIALLRGDDADRAEAEGWGVRWAGNAPRID